MQGTSAGPNHTTKARLVLGNCWHVAMALHHSMTFGTLQSIQATNVAETYDVVHQRSEESDDHKHRVEANQELALIFKENLLHHRNRSDLPLHLE